ncbi:MAG: DUF1232 domain-containing protein [Bacteroidales bacterium]|nr:DUF1232 domain-containing protein [Bacteroidales bacterium]
MIISICLLILAYTLSGRDVRPLLNKVRNANWVKRFGRLFKLLKRHALKAGRFATKPLLQLYYVVTDSETTLGEKALIYGCLIYIVMPASIIPQRIFKVLGLADEGLALATVVRKVKSKINADIDAKVEETLNRWFKDEEEAPGTKTSASSQIDE